jgi:sec-independent protein translocase protein TatA
MWSLSLTPSLGFMGMGFSEMALLGMVAVLLFGKNLPDVAKKLGGSYQQFRKGLSEFQSTIDISGEIDRAGTKSSRPRYDDYDDYEEVAAPKFTPPPAEPTVTAGEQSKVGS